MLGVPCLTLRTSTERPVTTTEGTNRLVGTDPGDILAGWQAVQNGDVAPRVPHYWDGKAAQRIVGILIRQAGMSLQAPPASVQA